MSMHKKPLTPLEEEGLRLHGLDIGKPSQLSDVFRHGVAWAISQDPEKTACEVLRARLAKYEDAEGRPLRAVVLPEPLKRGDEGGSGEYGAAMIRGFNACLREVARLNSSPVSSAPSDQYRYLIWMAHQLADMVLKGDAPHTAVRVAKSLMRECEGKSSAPSHGEQVRDGWTLVPKTLPCEMHSAFWNAIPHGPTSGIRVQEAWAAMLAATPSAASQEQGE